MASFPSPTTKWHSNTYPSLSPTRPELSAKETARRFAEAGASRIALLGRREQPLLDNKAVIESKYAGVKVCWQRENRHLISNAAVIGPQESVTDVEAEKFLKGIQTNLKGSMFVAKAFLRFAAIDAVVVEVSSFAAHLNVTTAFSAYTVAKLVVCRLWDCVTFANPTLSVFHVQPGVVDTAMNRKAGGVDAVGFSDNVSLPTSFNVWLASPEARFLKSKYLWANWDIDKPKTQAKEIESSAKLSIQLFGWPFEDSNWKGDIWKA